MSSSYRAVRRSWVRRERIPHRLRSLAWYRPDQGVTLRATRASGAETYVLSDGMTLTQSGETATFNTADFVDIGAATAAEVVAVINTDWATNSATDTTGDFTVTGRGVIGGTGRSALGLSVNPFVTQCDDLSGNVLHMVQATAADQVVWITRDAGFNNLPLLASQETGLTRFMDNGDTLAVADVHMFAAVAADNDPGLDVGGVDTGHFVGSSSGFSSYPFSTGSINETFGTSAGKNGNPTLALTTPHRYELVSAPSDFRNFVNDESIVDTGTNTVSFDSDTALFRTKGGDFSWLGRIGETAIMRALTFTERLAMTAYQTARFRF